ncbi:MAG: hypothetical protein R2711_13200 [Acidimicrobiales bacterium]
MTWAKNSYVRTASTPQVKQGIDAANSNGGASSSWVDGIKNGREPRLLRQDRWIRTLFESGLYQRGFDSAFTNAEGHLFAYATSIEDEVAPALGIEASRCPSSSTTPASSATRSTRGSPPSTRPVPSTRSPTPCPSALARRSRPSCATSSSASSCPSYGRPSPMPTARSPSSPRRSTTSTATATPASTPSAWPTSTSTSPATSSPSCPRSSTTSPSP